MTHLITYNESASKLYRQVDADEINRHMAGQQADNFTPGEIQALLDIVEGTGRKAEVVESNKDLDNFMFRQRGERIKIHTFNWDDDKSAQRDVFYRRTPPTNNVYIWDDGLFGQTFMVVNIYKSSDDWFYVSVKYNMHISAWVICDGFAGLKSLIIDLFESRKK
jgi:hypothetical protein